MRYIFLTTIFSVVFAYEKDMTFSVQAGKMDCFYQLVRPNEIIDLEYKKFMKSANFIFVKGFRGGLYSIIDNNDYTRVIDASHGELDISFQLTDPIGRLVVSDYKKSENAHRHTADHEGDHRFCFDNTFSTFSEKTVFFDLMIDTEDSHDKDYEDDDREMELGNAAETYMMRVRDISESVNRVRDNVSAARRLQELLSAIEARDRNVAEDMCSRVMQWSLGQIILMLVVGITQVFFLKSLFEEQSGRSFKKLVPDFLSQ